MRTLVGVLNLEKMLHRVNRHPTIMMVVSTSTSANATLANFITITSIAVAPFHKQNDKLSRLKKSKLNGLYRNAKRSRIYSIGVGNCASPLRFVARPSKI